MATLCRIWNRDDNPHDKGSRAKAIYTHSTRCVMKILCARETTANRLELKIRFIEWNYYYRPLERSFMYIFWTQSANHDICFYIFDFFSLSKRESSESNKKKHTHTNTIHDPRDSRGRTTRWHDKDRTQTQIRSRPRLTFWSDCNDDLPPTVGGQSTSSRAPTNRSRSFPAGYRAAESRNHIPSLRTHNKWCWFINRSETLIHRTAPIVYTVFSTETNRNIGASD